MTQKERPSVAISRRSLLSAFAGTAAGVALASVGGDRVAADSAGRDSTDPDSPDPDSTADDPLVTNSTGELLDAVSLGTFESSLDNWEADGAVELSRVARSDRPVAVTEGQYALEASAGGESAPAIARPVETLNLVEYPFFVADVTPGRVEGTDAPVAFQFRLYRPTDSFDGDSDDLLEGDSDTLLDADLELVGESDPVTVRQAASGPVFWDASDVDDGLLDAAAVLEMEWWPADQNSPDSSTGDFAYRGTTVFDAVRASASVDPVGCARLAATMRELQFDHGPYERTESITAFDAGEEGAFVFADGATEPYRFEVLGDDQFRLTVGETAVKLGGGWR